MLAQINSTMKYRKKYGNHPKLDECLGYAIKPCEWTTKYPKSYDMYHIIWKPHQIVQQCTINMGICDLDVANDMKMGLTTLLHTLMSIDGASHVKFNVLYDNVVEVMFYACQCVEMKQFRQYMGKPDGYWWIYNDIFANHVRRFKFRWCW